MIISRQHIFTGQVQGVGFRRRTRAIAAAFAVRGYVRNLVDGRVELRVEGDAAEVGRFVGDLRQQLASHITEEAVSDEAPAGYSAFEVRPTV